jgi:hypothetical protein
VQVFAARDFDCAQHLVAGVNQSDSIRRTALGKCFYPGINVEQEQTPMNREQAESTEKRPGSEKRSAGFQHGVMEKEAAKSRAGGRRSGGSEAFILRFLL